MKRKLNQQLDIQEDLEHQINSSKRKLKEFHQKEQDYIHQIDRSDSEISNNQRRIRKAESQLQDMQDHNQHLIKKLTDLAGNQSNEWSNQLVTPINAVRRS